MGSFPPHGKHQEISRTNDRNCDVSTNPKTLDTRNIVATPDSNEGIFTDQGFRNVQHLDNLWKQHYVKDGYIITTSSSSSYNDTSSVIPLTEHSLMSGDNFSNPQRTIIEEDLHLKRLEYDLTVTARKNNEDESFTHNITINAWRNKAQEKFQSLYPNFPLNRENPIEHLQNIALQ